MRRKMNLISKGKYRVYMFNPYPEKADPVKIRRSKDVAKWFVICN